jgi:hypothetical protein
MNKSKYFTGQPVFTQLLSLIPKEYISSLGNKYSANRYCKKFMAWDHLVTMLYAGFFQCTSLREVETGMLANGERLRHLGLQNSPARSTLSDANKRRSVDFFGDLYHMLYNLYFSPDSRPLKKEDKLFIVDSTTVSLFSEIMRGAGTTKINGKKKGGCKTHVLLDAENDLPAYVYMSEAKEHDLTFLPKIDLPSGSTIVMDKAYINYSQFQAWTANKVRWVTRLRNKSSYAIQSWNLVTELGAREGVRSDVIAVLGRPSNHKVSPLVKARIVTYYDNEKNREFEFITNDFDSEAFEIACIYKSRWQIEMLFKRIKQRYPLKYFLGDNPNAIKIQIWCALICDLLVKIVQKQVNSKRQRKWSYANLSGMIKHHLMTYVSLIPFLMEPDKTFKIYRPPEEQLTLFR